MAAPARLASTAAGETKKPWVSTSAAVETSRIATNAGALSKETVRQRNGPTSTTCSVWPASSGELGRLASVSEVVAAHSSAS